MDFKNVMMRLSFIVEIINNKKPFDKDIAEKLEMSTTNFSNMKQRGKIPFKHIVLFCEKYKVNLNWVLMVQTGILKDGTQPKKEVLNSTENMQYDLQYRFAKEWYCFYTLYF
jgi:DNA-binding Xre family transcriptional regulator